MTLHSIFDYFFLNPIHAFVIDNDHVITHHNSAMENLTGIAVDKIVGTRDPWKTFYAESRPTMADFIVDGASQEEIAEKIQMDSFVIKRLAFLKPFFAHRQVNIISRFSSAPPHIDTAGPSAKSI